MQDIEEYIINTKIFQSDRQYSKFKRIKDTDLLLLTANRNTLL